MELNGPEPIAPDHVVVGFESVRPVLDGWLVALALKNEREGGSRTYVASDGGAEIGYYGLLYVAGGMAGFQLPVGSSRRPGLLPLPTRESTRKLVEREAVPSGVATVDDGALAAIRPRNE